MNFNEKLQALRKQRGLTQEELAQALYVSRTAVSKWESGRGYPNIDSLKMIAAFFSVTVDELLSSDEVLTLAGEEEKRRTGRFCDRALGLLDLCTILLLFLPLFAQRGGEIVRAVSLPTIGDIAWYLIAAYAAVIGGMVVCGVLLLALQGCRASFWTRSKHALSLALGVVAVLLFVLSLQPYAAAFTLALLAIKAFILLRIT